MDCIIKHIEVEIGMITSTFKWSIKSLEEAQDCEKYYKHSKYRWWKREKENTINGNDMMVHVAPLMYLTAFNLVKSAGKHYRRGYVLSLLSKRKNKCFCDFPFHPWKDKE